MKYKIIGIGEILWDIYGSEKYLGGATANFTSHAHQLRQEGIIVSRVGKDKLGDEIICSLKKKGIHTGFIQQDNLYPTGTVYIRLLPGSVPKFLCSQNVAFDYLEFDKNLESLSEKADAVLFGSLAQRNEVSRKTIVKFLTSLKKAVKIYDINFRGFRKSNLIDIEKSLHLADILKSNKDELIKLKKIFNKKDKDDIAFLFHLLNEYKIRLICITLGKWGCLFLNKNEKFYSPGVKINAVDTVGAGDAFAAAFITSHLQKKPLMETAEFSNYIGAFVASKMGATPKYSKREINNFINTHKEKNTKKKLTFF